jgi:predicted nucleic acid-binding protein
MPKYFIDSNVFLRYYSHDDARQSEQAKAILLKAKAREIDLYCGCRTKARNWCYHL